MYEEQTFETILARCLTRVSGPVDKREGSILYDALAPACAELAGMYTELGTMLDRAFPDTAAGEDLDRKCAERSIVRYPATASVRKAIFAGASPAVGTRFSGGGVNYAVSAAEGNEFRVTAETLGVVGNAYFGTLLPIDYVEGLAAAELSDVLVPGEDEEGDGDLRARYFSSFDSQAFGGNAADYKQRVGALDGVGGVKVARAASGGGTVGVTIVSSDWSVPSDALVAAVQAAVDPAPDQGEGVGLAPIGHTVTVSGAAGKAVDVSFALTLEENVTWTNVQEAVETAIQGYFTELIQVWADSGSLTVRVSQVETRVLAVPGVLDVAGTALNAGAANLALAPGEIPVLGGVTNADP